MAQMLGMNIEEVEALSRELKTEAANIRTLASKLTGKLGATTWVGTDATRFNNDWNSRIKPALDRIAGEVDTAGDQAMRDAQEQRTTSA